ncbi:MAG: hypothetical protein GF384_00640 [Elusimicrobia bacterium]|nr:hypothetical protein [Elusimicrobiota bacterium]MBD3411594.1 hypothetical protein [Elusimicrobiota bacterium]
MNRDEAIKNITEHLKNDITSVFDKSPKRVYISANASAIIRIADYMFHTMGARFNIASAVDVRSHFEILYHFTIEDINLLISFRVTLDKAKPEIDSLTRVFKASDWIEREIHEMFGINFKGHPNLKRLLLSDDWPEDIHPLKCDYTEWDKKAVRDRGVT